MTEISQKRIEDIRRNEEQILSRVIQHLEHIKEQSFKLNRLNNEKASSGVIYQIKCQDCDKIYIGKTTKECVAQLIDNTINNSKNTSSNLLKHAKSYNHKFNFEDATILAHTEKKGRRTEP